MIFFKVSSTTSSAWKPNNGHSGKFFISKNLEKIPGYIFDVEKR